MAGKSRYGAFTDEELIARSRSGDSAATDFLMDKYKGLVRSRANGWFLPGGGDREDLIQEGMVGLFKALRDYESGKGTSFSTFAGMCISRQLYSAVESSGRKKHQILNDAVYGEEPLSGLAANGADPEQQFISEESGRELEENIRAALSPMEAQVLELYLEGMDCAAIAGHLCREPKAVDNALQRVKGKVRRLIKSEKAVKK